MIANIDQNLVKSVKPRPKPFEVWDGLLRGLVLRVQPTGGKIWIVEYARHRRVTIGRADVLSPAEARKEAKKKIADYVRGTDPLAEKKLKRGDTLEQFIAGRYGEWANANLKSAKETLRKFSAFGDLGKKRLSEITAWQIEKHRSRRIKDGTNPGTVNRELDGLRAALNKAVEWGLLASSPMRSVKRSRVDSAKRIRFLSEDETKRLNEALENREQRRRQNRAAFNAWRSERGYPTFPEYGSGYTDHLMPLVIVALNTGCRRGEIFNLRWSDYDPLRKMLCIQGQSSKTNLTRYIPLNSIADEVLQKWRKQSTGEFIFPGRDGGRLDNISTSWARLMRDAKIENFRFHDCRHDFASKLVMSGVDLNTVRELLGHSTIQMTLRYAHLAPNVKAAAVEKIVQRR